MPMDREIGNDPKNNTWMMVRLKSPHRVRCVCVVCVSFFTENYPARDTRAWQVALLNTMSVT